MTIEKGHTRMQKSMSVQLVDREERVLICLLFFLLFVSPEREKLIDMSYAKKTEGLWKKTTTLVVLCSFAC